MTPDAESIKVDVTITEAAEKLRNFGVDSTPFCGEDNRLKGILTDHDIEVSCIATDKDPNTVTAGEFGHEKPATIGGDNSIDEASATMKEHKVRHVPLHGQVAYGRDLIDIVAHPDIARSISYTKVGDLVELISS